MTLSYKRVLNPIDFDEHSIKATPTIAAELARYSAKMQSLVSGTTIFVRHFITEESETSALGASVRWSR
jgi:hypothetical protein